MKNTSKRDNDDTIFRIVHEKLEFMRKTFWCHGQHVAYLFDIRHAWGSIAQNTIFHCNPKECLCLEVVHRDVRFFWSINININK